MNEILAIARNTFKEAVRNRILYTILIFALLLILVSGVVSELTIASREQIIKSLGFSSISLFGVAVAVFVGVQLVYNELEKKSIYTIVSKPIGRGQFLLGKYFGLLVTVMFNAVVMTLFFLFSLHYHTAMETPGAAFMPAVLSSAGKAVVSFFWWGGGEAFSATHNVMPVIAVTMLELAMVTAFAVLYSSFTSPTLSMMFTVMTFVAGRMNGDIVDYAVYIQREAMKDGVDTPVSYYVTMGMAHVVPNFGAFERAVETAIYDNIIRVWWPGVIGYGLLYTVGVLALGTVIFQQRNFK